MLDEGQGQREGHSRPSHSTSRSSEEVPTASEGVGGTFPNAKHWLLDTGFGVGGGTGGRKIIVRGKALQIPLL